jgi:hypothetical protein
MTEKVLSDRVLARKKREAQALKANIQRRKEQMRREAQSQPPVNKDESADG